MKLTFLTTIILFSLAGPVAVLAEVPYPAIKSQADEPVPANVKSAAQQVVDALPSEAPAAGAGEVQQQAVAEAPAAEAVDTGAAAAAEQAPTVAADAKTPGVEKPARPCPKQGMGMRHMGKGRQGKGKGGMKHGAGHKGKGQPQRHEQVMRRLDMIEARMVKIEAMLESLMKRD